jgi:hypothetical protein
MADISGSIHLYLRPTCVTHLHKRWHKPASKLFSIVQIMSLPIYLKVQTQTHIGHLTRLGLIHIPKIQSLKHTSTYLIDSLRVPSKSRVFLITFHLAENHFKSQRELYIPCAFILRTLHVAHRANLSVPHGSQINNNYFALSLTFIIDNYVFSVRQ